MAQPETLVDLLRIAAKVTDRGYTFLDPNSKENADKVWTFNRLFEEATRRGRYFRSLGLEKGDRLAMIVPEGEDFVLSFFGAVVAGIVPVPMYPPLALGKLDSYIQSAERVLEISGAKMLLTTKQVSPIVWSLMSKVKGLQELILTEKVREHDGSKVDVKLDPIHGSDPCFLQFTSGSTSDPKGVVVSHANLVANAKAIMIDGLKSEGPRDKGVSWLPLYHDMGLIGFVIAPLYNQVPVVFLPTLAFVKRPGIWMETVSKYGGTITFAPNFAFGLATKRVGPKAKEALDLSKLRVLGCGAEPINAKTMRVFCDTFAPCGFNPNALMPAYGMAEATLAIAFDDLSRPITSVTIDREVYEAEKIAKRYEGSDEKSALELVAVGRSFEGHEVGILGPSNQLLGEGEVGEIGFRGASITNGYFQNPEATAALLDGGWLHTGDLGFLLDGELYISGRKKDLIILNGRNYYPQAIEWEVEQVEGVRKGNVVAFSVRGENTEELVIVAECKMPDKEAMSAAIARQVQTTLGLAVKDVMLVGAGALPKTSSGKLQRQKTKLQYESGELGRAGNRSLGSTATKVQLFRHITMSAFARFSHTIKGSLPAMGRSRRLETRSAK